jgi:hypothetical protein
MNAKQTPLVDILRLHAEDLHSDYGHNKSARLLSQAADEIERLRSNSLALEDEKNDYMDGVGDVLRQDHDGETLWAAAQRVMSECDRLRAELAEARRDAERYRWLRSDDCPFSCYEQEGPDNWGWCPTSSRDLDEAIDAAMAGGANGN